MIKLIIGFRGEHLADASGSSLCAISTQPQLITSKNYSNL